MEACRLRVLDIDFEMRQITVRNGKGAKDRVTMLPSSLVEPLKSHLQLVKLQHERDCEQGCGQVYLPFALDRKYPNAPAEWKWQYVFPANRLSTDPRSGDLRRHHIEVQKVQRAVRQGSAGRLHTQESDSAYFAAQLRNRFATSGI